MQRSMVMVMALGATVMSVQPASAGPTREAVQARDKVVCGVNGSRAGWSALDSEGRWQGMDVDTCKAVAAAVLGDQNKVEFIKTTTQTRFTALQTGQVDVLTRNVTWTLGRDARLGVDFVQPTFYDGQGFMVPRALGVTAISELDGATVCVLPGSTSEKITADVFNGLGNSYTPVVIEQMSELTTAFFGGRCDVHVQSVSGLSATRATVAANPDDYVILPGVFGKDPMGPVVAQGDPEWRDIVAWSVYALIEAEEAGITSANVDAMRGSEEAAVQRLLGTRDNLGEGLGLDAEWAYRIIKQVGNYGEVFDRNVGKDSPLKLERGINDLWTRGGLLYAPPFIN